MQTQCYQPGYCHCRGVAEGCWNCNDKWYKGHPCGLPRAASERHEEEPLCAYCLPHDKRGPRPCCIQVPPQYAAPAPPAQTVWAAFPAAPSSSVAMAVSYPQHAPPPQTFSAAVSAAPSSSVAMGLAPAPLCSQPNQCHCKGGHWGCNGCGHKRWKGKACPAARARTERGEQYPLCHNCVDDGGVGGPRHCCTLPGAPATTALEDVGPMPVLAAPPGIPAALMQPTPASVSYDRPPAEEQTVLRHLMTAEVEPTPEPTPMLPTGHCPRCQELRKIIKDLVILNNLTVTPDLEQHLLLESEVQTVSDVRSGSWSDL